MDIYVPVEKKRLFLVENVHMDVLNFTSIVSLQIIALTFSLVDSFIPSVSSTGFLSRWGKKGRGCQVVRAELQGKCLFPGKAIRGQVQMPSCSLGTVLLPPGSVVREQRGSEPLCQLLVMLGRMGA